MNTHTFSSTAAQLHDQANNCASDQQNQSSHLSALLYVSQLLCGLRPPIPVQVDHTFDVTNVGTVVSGRLLSGSISIADQLVLGPLSNGEFACVAVHGIQRSQVCHFPAVHHVVLQLLHMSLLCSGLGLLACRIAARQ